MDVTEYPVAIAACLYVIKMLFEYIKELKKDKEADANDGMSDTFKKTFYDMRKEVQDMHDWLGKEDSDGRKLCYTPKSHDESLKRIDENIAANTVVLDKLHNTLVRIEST